MIFQRHGALGLALAVCGTFAFATDAIPMRRAFYDRPLPAIYENSAADPLAQSEGRKLRVLSYNIQGLPFGVDHSRYRDIGSALRKKLDDGTAPDVVLIQEAFHGRTRELIRTAGYPHHAFGPRQAGVRQNAGLIILSRYPILRTENSVYGACAGPDCLSRKGVQMASILVPGVPRPVEIYNTHMNAGYHGSWPGPRESDLIRQRQIVQIRDFLKKVRDPSAPAIFGGDFNFRGYEPAYAAFTSMWPGKNGAKACISFSGCEREERFRQIWKHQIDHIYYATDTSQKFDISPVRYAYTFTDQQGGRYLSDHFGVEMDLRLTW